MHNISVKYAKKYATKYAEKYANNMQNMQIHYKHAEFLN